MTRPEVSRERERLLGWCDESDEVALGEYQYGRIPLLSEIWANEKSSRMIWGATYGVWMIEFCFTIMLSCLKPFGFVSSVYASECRQSMQPMSALEACFVMMRLIWICVQ